MNRPFFIKSFRSLLIGLLLIAAVAQVLAQAPNSFRHLRKSDGLSQSSVFAIAQDSAGFMWFGTRDGLNRYDGHDFRIYRKDSVGLGPIGNDVRVLHYDRLRRGMWVGTTDGLSFFDPAADRFEHYPSVEGGVLNMFQNEHGTQWVVASSGIYRYYGAQKQFRQLVFGGFEREDTQVTVLLEQEGVLYLGTNRGLYRAVLSTGGGSIEVSRFTLKGVDIDGQRIESIYHTENGTLFMGTLEGGVFRCDLNTGEGRRYRHKNDDEDSLADDNVRSLLPDGQGGLWIGTFNGLSHLDIITGDIKTDRSDGLWDDELSNNSIHSLFKDAIGSIWVGTYYGGVNHLNPVYSRFRSYVKTKSSTAIGANIVSSFAEDEIGNIYVGTEGAGLEYLDVEADTFRYFRPDASKPTYLSGTNVKSMLIDKGKLWIGTYKEGLNVLNIRTGKFKRYRSERFLGNSIGMQHDWLPSNSVYSLLKQGDYLWLGTYGGGLSLFDTQQERFLNFRSNASDESSLASDLVNVIYKKDGQYWIGTEAGLQQVIVNDEGLPVRFENILPDIRVRVIYEDDKGTLWAGTLSRGLVRIEGGTGRVTEYTVVDGLAGNTVYGILEDEQGRLWLSTNDGLSRFDAKAEIFTNFEHPNGMTTREFNFGAFLKTSSGEFFFGGLDGFTRFHPSNIKESQFPSPLVFTGLKKNGQLLRPGESNSLDQSIDNIEELSLAYNDANFTVGVAALDFLHPDSRVIQYKLEGLDPDWKTANGKIEATYTIQRAGTYTFSARTFTGGELVNKQTRKLLISVLPPPWRTWWAYLAYVCIGILSIYTIFRFFNLRHNYQLEHLAHQRDEDLNEGKLRFFTNITHEFRTPLTLILGPLGDLLKDRTQNSTTIAKLQGIDRNSRKLLALVDRVLTFRTLASEHGEFRGSRNDVNQFLRKLHEPFFEEAKRRKISLELNSPSNDLWAWFDIQMLEMAVASLLSNALKFTPDGGTILLSYSQTLSKRVRISVADNGPGVVDELKAQVFKRFFEDPKHSHVAGSGIGLSVASELVALHQGKIFVEDNDGGGAIFIIEFPVGAQHFVETPREDDVVSDMSGEALETQSELALVPIDELVASRPTDQSMVLIVEDNQELRNYLVEVLSAQYKVKTAKNGEEGLLSAKAMPSPDLILSDVMMPVMDGVEMCRQIKTSLKTSHIPVLLLTAKTSERAKLDGLRIGADDYIPKPFVAEELLLRVQNTLETRRQVRETFSSVVSLDPGEISITSADEIFLRDTIAYVEEHMDDLELSVVTLASAMNVSRALLFTKLKALTDQTPGNFIKSMRIKRAAQLLATNKLNIAQVAYKVGFRDPKYFSKCFKEVYGETATAYMKNRIQER